MCLCVAFLGEKKKISDSVIWQKPLHPQKNPKSNVATQNATKNFDDTKNADLLLKDGQMYFRQLPN